MVERFDREGLNKPLGRCDTRFVYNSVFSLSGRCARPKLDDFRSRVAFVRGILYFRPRTRYNAEKFYLYTNCNNVLNESVFGNTIFIHYLLYDAIIVFFCTRLYDCKYNIRLILSTHRIILYKWSHKNR